MSLSVLDIFKIGLGPSSSHTMGPMNAASAFVAELVDQGLLERTDRVGVQLYGSLALTGRGHCTDRAVLLGLEGHRPDGVLRQRRHRRVQHDRDDRGRRRPQRPPHEGGRDRRMARREAGLDAFGVGQQPG